MDIFLGSDMDDFTRGQGRAIKRDYDRIRRQIKANGGSQA